MPRKVIIDCDPGIDDAVALTMALFDPRLEVVAVTAVAGNVGVDIAAKNIQALVERLDPPRYPRIGQGTPPDTGPGVDARDFHGDDGLGNVGFTCSQLVRQHTAEKIIADEIRLAPDEVTILCLGPLTNIARTFQRDPALLDMVDRIVILGGAMNCVGNITPTAEFNIYCDPESARTVFKLPITKTLIPLDVTDRVTFDIGLLSQLPDEATRAGNVLRKILPFSFRVYRMQLGQESINLRDAVAVAALIHPELFEMVELSGDVETSGVLTAGTTVFDRRRNYRGPREIAVARDLDTTAVTDCILRGIQEAGKATG